MTTDSFCFVVLLLLTTSCRLSLADSDFKLVACVDPWKNRGVLSNTEYYLTADSRSCFTLCRDHKFALIKGQKCTCAHELDRDSKLDDSYCIMDGSSVFGGNLGSSVYCKGSDDACKMELNQADPYPRIDEDVVSCLGGMCGILSNANDEDRSEYFPELQPQDCIKFCAYLERPYAYLGYVAGRLAGSQGGAMHPFPHCICRDSPNGSTTITTSECSSPCPGDNNYNCGYLSDNTNDETKFRWTVYCTTKYFAENSSCLTKENFSKENFGSKEEVCPATTTVVTTSAATSTTVAITTAATSTTAATTTVATSTTVATTTAATSTTVATTTATVETTSTTTATPTNATITSKTRGCNFQTSTAARRSYNTAESKLFKRSDSIGYSPNCEKSNCLDDNDCHFNDNCYQIIENYNRAQDISYNLATAHDVCDKNHRSRLVAIETPEERHFITQTYRGFGVVFGWADILTSGIYVKSENRTYWNVTGKWIEINSTWETLNYETTDTDAVVWLAQNNAPENEKDYSITKIGYSSSSFIMCEYSIADTTTWDPDSDCTTTTEETTTPSTTTTTETETSTSPSSTTTTPTTTTISSTRTTSPTTTTTTTVTTPSDPPVVCYCNGTDSFGQSWNVSAGTEGLKACPFNQTGNITWKCEVDTSTGNCKFTTKLPGYSDCHNQWLSDVTTDIAAGKNASLILEQMDNETNTANYYGHEIDEIVEAINNALELERKQLQLDSSDPNVVLKRAVSATKRGTSVLNNLIIHDEPWDQIEENRTGVATKILNGSEAVGLWLSDVSRSVHKSLNCEIEFLGILLGSIWWDRELQDLLDCDLQVLDNNTLTKEVQFPSQISRDSRITLPWASSSTTRIYNAVGIIYNSTIIAESFPGHKNTFGESERDKHIISPVLSYTVVGEFIKDIKVNLVFRHQEEAKNPPVKNLRRNRRKGEEPSPVISSSICSFINFNPENGEDWSWDNEGCVVKQTNRTHTVCECNHLTSFANLMDIHNYTGPDAGLELTSMICSSMSALSLFFTIVLLSSLRQIRNDRTAITQNLCLCLMISHLLILNVFDRNTYDLSDEVCAAFGIVLHYALLASFTWMVVEGLRLCQVIVDTFRTGSSKTVIFYCIGYGVPLVIVLVTVIVAAASADGVTGAYAQDETCWLRVDDYIWSYSGPIAAILLLNLLCLVFAVITSSRLEFNRRRKLNQQIRSTASMTLSLSVLLGLTWILGYFIFSETPVFAYLFTIVNGLQGVLIFLFRCVLNEPVRMAVRRMTKRTKQSLALRMQLHNSNRSKSKISKTESKSTSLPREGRPAFTGAQIYEILTRKTSESGTSGICRHGTSITSIDSAWSSMGRKDSAFPDEVSIRSDDHMDYHRYSFDSYSDNYY